MTTKKSSALTLHDRLSRLSFRQACQLLGPDAERIIMEGGKLELESFEDQVSLSSRAFRVSLPDATVTISLAGDRRRPVRCSSRRTPAPRA